MAQPADVDVHGSEVYEDAGWPRAFDDFVTLKHPVWVR
jgi:hypothetical protein